MRTQRLSVLVSDMVVVSATPSCDHQRLALQLADTNSVETFFPCSWDRLQRADGLDVLALSLSWLPATAMGLDENSR